MMNGGGSRGGRVRRPWLIAGGVVACWLVLLLLTGSAAGAFVILVVAALAGVVIFVGLRTLGILDRPFFRGLGGAQRAVPQPAHRDFAAPGWPEQPVNAGPVRPAPARPVPSPAPARREPPRPVPDEAVTQQLGGAQTVLEGEPTVIEQVRSAVPSLRLVTGSAVAHTRQSGARAGRGPVELRLPDVPTVSRVHARFTCTNGQWWVTNEGANGLCVNGSLVTDQHPLHDGDEIRWGQGDRALTSRVEVD